MTEGGERRLVVANVVLALLVALAAAPQPGSAASFPAEPSVGGVVVEISSLSAENLSVDTVDGETSENDSATMAVLRFENVSVERITVTKNFEGPGQDGSHVLFQISNVTTRPTLTVAVSELYADRLVTDNDTVTEFWTTDPENESVLTDAEGGAVSATNLTLNAHYLYADALPTSSVALADVRGQRNVTVNGTCDGC